MKAFVFALLISLTAFHTTPSQALVGVALQKKSIKAIGGIAAAGGGTLAVMGIVAGKSASGLAAAATAMFTGAGFLGFLGGLVILEGDRAGELSFSQITNETRDNYPELSDGEIEQFNQQVDLKKLNAISQTITMELAQVEKDEVEAAKELWLQYSQSLHPNTAKVATVIAYRFFEDNQ